MRRLMEILLYEKRQGFQRGGFLLDSIAAALASHLIHYYSTHAPVIRSSVGGMAPSTLEADLRLDELAREAGMSASHFIRSFRESTGKTPSILA
jgi:AraC family transcriptional regulator